MYPLGKTNQYLWRLSLISIISRVNCLGASGGDGGGGVVVVGGVMVSFHSLVME